MKTRRLVNKVRKSFRYGEKGFTLIELLIVVAILGILAAVVLPNVGGFLRSGHIASANSEVATIKTAAAAYYSQNGTWPTSSAQLYPAGLLDRDPSCVYTIAPGGELTNPVPNDWGEGLNWETTTNDTWD